MANDKLTWVELRKAVAETANISDQEAGQFLNALLEAISTGLKEDKQVKIKGIGTFALKAVAPRKSVNIATGEEFTIEEFKPGMFKLISQKDCATVIEEKELEDMLFTWKIVKYVKSNAICIVKNGVTLAIGGGQTSRVWALENAIHNNPDKDFKGSVLASDAFFPFNDCVQVAANAKVSAIVQPGGSIKDQDSIDLCNELNIPMVFTGYRHFRH